MIRIASMVATKSYSPELYALQEYFNRSSDICFDLIPTQCDAPAFSEYDAMYLGMGFSPFWNSDRLPEIHDYSSASTGQFPRIKDAVKRNLSRRPILRSFLSDFVRTQLRFRDTIPYFLRDMGVPDSFISARAIRSSSPSYDLFYAGSIGESRNTDLMLSGVARAGLTILLAGEPSPYIVSRYRGSRYVTFAGRVAHREIPTLAADCRMGLNYTPDIYPYRHQTSTKVLEYLALGLPVITNDYAWIRRFEAESSAAMYKFRSFADLRFKDDFDYVVPEMTRYSWNAVFQKSGIAEQIRNVV